jgi:hypothetical protein
MIGRTLGLAAVAWLSCVGALAAQTNPGDVKHRNDCRLAAQILSHGQPDVKRPWALGVIGTCEEGASILLQVWGDPPPEDAELQQLYHASARSGDGRVFEAAFSVAADPSAPAPARVAALGAVVSSVRPELTLYLEDRSPLEGIPPLEWNDLWGTIDHPVQLDGEVPIPADAEGRVVSLVLDLAANAGESLVRDAAWWLVSLHGFGS